jgi:hypothetical protein
MQLTVEACSSVCINPLQRTIKRQVNRDYPESSTEEIYNYTLIELNKFSVNDQFFQFEAIKNFLGGYRWFFLCPKCNKRSSKLFLPPEGMGRETKYFCKSCQRLKNQSALSGQNNMYRKVTRPLKKMKEIENKIAKGHLRGGKVEQLLDEHEKLDKELRGCQEYRLYTFKKKHNLT